MNTKPCTTIALLLFFSVSFSQSNLYDSPRSIALGGAYTTLADVWSPTQNIAGIAKYNKLGIGASYAKPFGIKELSHQRISATIPTSIGGFGLHYQSFGFSLYREQNFGFAYSKLIGENVSAGFKISYANYHIAASGNTGQVYSAAGIQYTPTPQIRIGASINNPEKGYATINNEEIQIPSYYALGLMWVASEELSFNLEFDKDSFHTALTKFAIEYKYRELLFLRGGINGKPVSINFGLGLKLKSFMIDYAASFHEVLGTSSSIGLTYIWDGNE